MTYKVPEKVFSDFEYIGGRNYSTKDHKHIQTFAYLIGEEESSNEIECCILCIICKKK